MQMAKHKRTLSNPSLPDMNGVGIWDHFTVRDGLPDMKIECVFEDSQGVIWIGTHDRGVVAYEGDEFRSYTVRDGLAADGVFSILEDSEGTLWFGTNRGLIRFDGREFEHIAAEEPCGLLWGSCIDDRGLLWFGLESRPQRPPAVCVWDGIKLRLIELDSEPTSQGKSIHKVFPDEEGCVWLGGHELFRQTSSLNTEFVEVSCEFDGAILDVLRRRDGSLLMAADNGLWSIKGGNLEAVVQDSYVATSLTEDRDGICWVMTSDGQLLTLLGDDIRQVSSLNCSHRGGFCLDRLGRLWVGTYGMGLFCYDSTRVRIYRQEEGLPANSVACMAGTDDGRLLVGTARGLVAHEDGSFAPFAEAEGISEEGIAGIVVDANGQIWVGTRRSELHLLARGVQEHYTLSTELDGHFSIASLVTDRDGTVWFSSPARKGFGYCKDGLITFFSPRDRADCPAWVRAIEVDQDDNVWIGSSSPVSWDGLCRYDGERFQRVEGISGAPILSLCCDKQGRMWIGTNEGVNCCDEAYFISFTQEDGLPCELVTAIAAASDGSVWIGTEGGGLCHYDGEIMQVWQVPDDPACNVIHAIHEDGEGRVWCGTEGGLIRLSSRVVRPRVAVTEVLADTAYPAPSELQFPTTVGRIRFCFRGVSPQEHSSNLVYRHKLIGYDNEWRQVRELEVEYPQLHPGDYTFSVQAIDRDMNYSDVAEVSLTVVADPRIEALTDALRAEASRGEFIGESTALLDVRRQIQEVAWTDLTVLVLGETGTGKGLAARAIHSLSERSDGPFIQVSCGALQEGLIDSELFGHERGAFTGAVSRKLGKFELAEGGTIFLDEIGDLPLDSQTRLLTVLQERCIERVGGTQTIPVNVRVIAATNRDLVTAVRQDAYRADLYYRLNVFPIRIPPLRERKDDTPLLAEYFVRRFAAHLNQEAPQITEEASAALLSYDWPGNVRELEHTLQRAVILSREGEIRPEHVGFGHQPDSGGGEEHQPILPLEEFERRYLERVLDHTGGIIHGERGAARLLHMKPTTLRSRLEKLGLKKRRAIGQKPSSN